MRRWGYKGNRLSGVDHLEIQRRQHLRPVETRQTQQPSGVEGRVHLVPGV
jgi:hypothetical protein